MNTAVTPSAFRKVDATDLISERIILEMPFRLNSAAAPNFCAIGIVKARGIYTAGVLWNKDPLGDSSSAEAHPVVTLAVRGSWFSELEHSAQKHVDEFLAQTDTLPLSQQFRKEAPSDPDSPSLSVFANSNVFRYVSPQAQAKNWTLVEQIRVRWWAMTDDNLSGIREDQIRVQRYVEQLSRLISAEET